MSTRFEQAEEEFYRLRGQFAVGRISAEEFDAALQKLSVQDEEGRVWMLGANTGRWYYISPQWVEGEPLHATDATETVVLSNRAGVWERTQADDAPSATSSQTEEPDETGARKKFALAFLGLGVAFAIGATLVFGWLNNEMALFASEIPPATPTRIVPLAALAPTQALSQPPSPTPPHTRAAQETIGTPVPITATPALMLEPTSTEPALTVIPTITPNPNQTRTLTESNVALPPAVYVTNIRVSPNPPSRRAEITFTASFYNTNRESVGMNWRIILLDPNKEGRNKDFGESPFAGITVPPGRTDFAIRYVPVNTGGACLTLQVLAARRQDDNSRVYLLGTHGSPYAANVTFC